MRAIVAYIVYRIALCLHLEIYLTLSIIILNETIRAELIVFIALFADLGTIAIAYDNAPYARDPVEWQLPKIWLISTILGALLAAATWVLRGTLFLSNGGIIQNYGSVQEILFLEVALTEVSSSPSPSESRVIASLTDPFWLHRIG